MDLRGERTTAAFILNETAKFNKIDPQAHIYNVLQHIVDHTISQTETLVHWVIMDQKKLAKKPFS